MSVRKKIAALAFAATATIFGSAWADDDGPARRACMGRGENFSPFITVKEVIDGCTKLIRSGRYQGDELMAFYFQRGQAHLQSNAPDEAIEDFGQAIALKPN